jgi:hypothetical protein
LERFSDSAAEVVVEVAEVALTEDEVGIEVVEVDEEVVHPWLVVEERASTSSTLPKSTNSTRSSGTPSSRLLIGMSQLTTTHTELTNRQTERVFSLKGFTHQPAENIKFLLTGKDGAADKMVTIVEYYKKTYNATVTKPRLPCVQYGNKNFVP